MESEFRTHTLLKPLSWLYSAVTGARNMLYDHGYCKSTAFGIPVICVGNIAVGGTGKTPHSEYLISLIKDRVRTALLSRGYGRATRGYILADSASDYRKIGDEPFQIHSRFPDISVAVCEDRVEGVRRLLAGTDTAAVILDDAFQHRRIRPSLSILLTDWSRLLTDDCVMPAGHLRESAWGRSRADIIIVTKCPDSISAADMESLNTELAVRPGQKVFFSTFDYGRPFRFTDGAILSRRAPVLAVAGIARPQPFADRLESDGHRVRLMPFADHHAYSAHDLKSISRELDEMGADAVIVTTAKDAARLKASDLSPQLADRIYVMPVGVRFIRDGEEFDSIVLGHLESFKKQ